jgi:hypothetical protein
MKNLMIASTAIVAVTIFLSLGSRAVFAQNAARPYTQQRLNPTNNADVRRGIEKDRAQRANGNNISTQKLYDASRSNANTNYDAKGGNKQ